MQDIKVIVIPFERQIYCLACEGIKFLELNIRTQSPSTKIEVLLHRTGIAEFDGSPRLSTKPTPSKNSCKNKYKYNKEIAILALL